MSTNQHDDWLRNFIKELETKQHELEDMDWGERRNTGKKLLAKTLAAVFEGVKNCAKRAGGM